MLGVVGQQRSTKCEQLNDALVGDPVVDGRVVTPSVHEAAPAQARQVV